MLSGLVGMYLIRDQFDTGRVDNPLRLPADGQEIELILQDRLFDTNGQLLFPDGSNPEVGEPPNPEIHPFWIPEFFGDVNVVNGRSWPFLNVEGRRYRFRIVDAANARFYRMKLVNSRTGAPGPPIWLIGTDGGLLDRPVKLADPAHPDARPLVLAPAERADVIVDFHGFEGQSFTLVNDAAAPFPGGDAVDPATTGRVMQFRVDQRRSGRDDTYDPGSGAPLRGGRNQEPAIVRLADPNRGTLAPGVRVNTTRQLVLVEVEGAGGPIEVLLNNTKWDGTRDDTGRAIPGSQPDSFGVGNFLTELPRVGSTEVWEIGNLSEDAHPIHIHLIQFQVINRQEFARDAADEVAYRAHYDAAFPGGVYVPEFGPPRTYTNTNGDGAVGGNPSFSRWLTGPTLPPEASEVGWKDTLKMFPGQVTRIVARWAPQATAVGGVQPGQNQYTFDPTRGPGYAWHCHILDHEDNEMMRPYIPVR
jgi:spore coat protein A